MMAEMDIILLDFSNSVWIQVPHSQRSIFHRDDFSLLPHLSTFQTDERQFGSKESRCLLYISLTLFPELGQVFDIGLLELAKGVDIVDACGGENGASPGSSDSGSV
eukprot:Platyproteum_vivax@DN7184_c0_g1_i4.p1